MIELRRLSINDGIDVYSLLQDIPKEENGFGNNANGLTYDEYKEWLVKRNVYSNQIGLLDGWRVPETTFFLYVDDTPVGMGSIRHFLTDALKEVGGHIGYCISPKYRQKGYGRETMKKVIELIKSFPAGKTDYCCLSYEPENEIARKLYLSLGFEERLDLYKENMEITAVLKL